MKFSQMTYERINEETTLSRANELLSEISEAKDFEEHYQVFEALNQLRSHNATMKELAGVRHSVNTLDAFYEGEVDFWDEFSPKLQEIDSRLAEIMLASPFRKAYEDKLGSHYFDQLALVKKTFDPIIMDDLAEENRLASAYDKLMAAAQIEFRGEVYTLAGLGIFREDPDRATRKEAAEATWQFMQDNQAELDDIYHKLVQVRDKMAKKLGYENFIPMAYDRFSRTDYNASDVKRFRDGIIQHVVPLAAKGYQEQTERLGLDELTYYDLPYKFTSGNPRPQGDKEYLVTQATAMYDELSPETSQFFRLMVESELLDLEQKPGKQPGGYCTFFDDYQLPFIFSNFNGTSGDVDVLTHEFGHAFQVYTARDLISDLRWPGMEAAEIHSMGMEYIAYPWMERFFGDQVQKYYYDHNVSNIAFLPYGSLVDAFQHYVYANPQVTPAERSAEWRRLEGIYTPWVNYQDNEYLQSGRRWQMQGHIYGAPFYYIDYCLAQICAMQIFTRSQQDQKALWDDYVAISQVGGSLPFTKILEVGHFENPFDEAVVKRSIQGVQDYLETIDVKAFS